MMRGGYTYLDYLKSDTGNVTDGVALAAEPGDKNLILQPKCLCEQNLQFHHDADTSRCLRARGAGGGISYVLVDEVKATIARDERRNLLAILDELYSHALSDSRVRLLRLNANLLEHDALGVGRATERLGVLLAQVGLLVILVCPLLRKTVCLELAGAVQPSRLPAKKIPLFEGAMRPGKTGSGHLRKQEGGGWEGGSQEREAAVRRRILTMPQDRCLRA